MQADRQGQREREREVAWTTLFLRVLKDHECIGMSEYNSVCECVRKPREEKSETDTAGKGGGGREGVHVHRF